MPHREHQKLLSVAVVVAALGYFVDVYDLVLFSVVRVASLRTIGVRSDQLLDTGIYLLNVQMVGTLVGGIVWGILGDKIGRIKVLFASILMYSAANIGNAFVGSVEAYAIWRLIAGFGLAGELGAGVTLVTEILPQRLRGYGTTIVATIGVAGAIAAGLVGQVVDWRVAYGIGGAMGLALLIVRVSVHESGMFHTMTAGTAERGNLALLLFNPRRLIRYLACVMVGLPVWYVVGILVSFSPEIAEALRAPHLPVVGVAISWCYVGLVFGDLAGGLLSQYLQSRKRALAAFLALGLVLPHILLSLDAPSLNELYLLFGILGFSAGYWVLVVTTSAEQFGTNIRATVTTTVPNFIRGAVVPMTQLFVLLKSEHGVLTSAASVGLIVSGTAIVALLALRETFSENLDYVE